MSHEAAMALFVKWFEEASKSEPNDPNAMFIATVDETGMPNNRVVLMKAFDNESITFYTNLESAKGVELLANPNAALCFDWKSLNKQVFVQGCVEVVMDSEADDYFKSRARKSQIAAWASQQSRPMSSRAIFVKRIAKYALKFGIGAIPRPPPLEWLSASY